MSLYPLGISRSRDVQVMAEEATLGQVSVRWVVAPELAAAVHAPERGPQPWQHAAAIDAIHHRICVLPVRFQTVVRDEAEIRSLLEGRRDVLRQRLDWLDGACEMGLRITLSKCRTAETNRSHAPSPNLSYLDQRRAHYQSRDSLDQGAGLAAERLVREFEGTYRVWRSLTPWPRGVVRVAFLVERELVGLFVGRLAASSTKAPDVQRTLLGPWPPYSFV